MIITTIGSSRRALFATPFLSDNLKSRVKIVNLQEERCALRIRSFRTFDSKISGHLIFPLLCFAAKLRDPKFDHFLSPVKKKSLC
ncbi:hypothetical protein CICLE_v10023112mg [Citrus x clementina]|uniref:Uncharacterized protein n=1 Tax=Citrus clementina TaxID=85681 RepID=V4U6R6_CITCL|nr:hypothetical protein CICLE_v10023112mg [Citrus x clementina]